MGITPIGLFYMTYASIVSKDSVRIFSLDAVLNKLDNIAEDIQNAYPNTDTKKESFFYAGDELNLIRGDWLLLCDIYMG